MAQDKTALHQSAAAQAPSVYLVGAGPGDPGLLTQAGAAVLARAAVVIYDALANPELLNLCPPDCERIFVGKSASRHTLSQDRINALLVEKARELAGAADASRVVVRLKGGDPYVFGRGGEEGQVLTQAGVRFAVVPGITAGLAGPAYAGIPVTHRELTSTVTLVTGHERQGGDQAADAAPRVNYRALAQLGGTLVFYMGVRNLPEICAGLIAGGLKRETPAAIVRYATWPEQRTLVSTIAELATRAREAGFEAPAIVVIGEVVSLRESLNWFERQPLFGRTIVVTRTRQQAGRLTAQLTQLGARVLEAPTIAIAPPEAFTDVDAAVRNLPLMDCAVFTSAHGVQALWQRLRALKMDSRSLPKTVAAVGPATAQALEEIGILAQVIPEEFVSDKLAAQLRGHFGGAQGLHGQKIMLLRADIARPALRQELERLGAEVADVAIYRTQSPPALPDAVLAALEAGQVDWITFTSASTARNFHALLPEHLRATAARIKRISIGPVTSAALRDLSAPPTIEAQRHDIAGMVESLLKAISGTDMPE